MYPSIKQVSFVNFLFFQIPIYNPEILKNMQGQVFFLVCFFFNIVQPSFQHLERLQDNILAFIVA